LIATATLANRTIMAVLLSLSSLCANAAFKCTQDGRILYSDHPCAGGIALAPSDLRKPATLEADLQSAQQRAAAEKRQLHELEESRRRTERMVEQQRARAAAIAARRQRQCAALALKRRWAAEDAALASSQKAEKSRRQSRRLGEKYALECAT
jgi:hypothetical protein